MREQIAGQQMGFGGSIDCAGAFDVNAGCWCAALKEGCSSLQQLRWLSSPRDQKPGIDAESVALLLPRLNPNSMLVRQT